MSDLRLADTILVVRRGDKFELRIDGERFPFAIGQCNVDIEPDSFPSVTIRVLANSVSVENEVESLVGANVD